jgi:hypothetical protein
VPLPGYCLHPPYPPGLGLSANRRWGRDQLNAMLWHVYGEWDISGVQQAVDGRMTWPVPWTEAPPRPSPTRLGLISHLGIQVDKYLMSATADDLMDNEGSAKVPCVNPEQVAAIRDGLFLSGQSATSVTWQALQKAFKVRGEELSSHDGVWW